MTSPIAFGAFVGLTAVSCLATAFFGFTAISEYRAFRERVGQIKGRI